MTIRERIRVIVGFPIQGNFKDSLIYLDKSGAVDKKKQLDMILALCEAVETLENASTAQIGASVTNITAYVPKTKKTV